MITRTLEVVLLPKLKENQNPGDLMISDAGVTPVYRGVSKSKSIAGGFGHITPHEMYWVDPCAEIKEGDWYIDISDGSTSNCLIDAVKNIETCKKILVSTQKLDGILQIGPADIKEYANKPYSEVEVEIEKLMGGSGGTVPYEKIKTDVYGYPIVVKTDTYTAKLKPLNYSKRIEWEDRKHQLYGEMRNTERQPKQEKNESNNVLQRAQEKLGREGMDQLIREVRGLNISGPTVNEYMTNISNPTPIWRKIILEKYIDGDFVCINANTQHSLYHFNSMMGYSLVERGLTHYIPVSELLALPKEP